MGPERSAAEWELLHLLTEVRRRARRLDGKSLRDEPGWVAALPPRDARLARSLLAVAKTPRRRSRS